MRRKDREVTDVKEIENILESCKTASIAMTCDGVPYVVPLSYGYELTGKQLILYFHSAKEGIKIDVLKLNPTVCFSIFEEGEPVHAKTPCNAGYYYSSVIGLGTVEFVEEAEEKQRALGKMFSHQAGKEVVFTEAQADTVCVFKVISEEFTGKRKANMYEFKKDYKENEKLRVSFNALAERTFGLNFEDWYQNGYWRENYIPYSMVCDGKVIANVSVNLTEMLLDGEPRKLIQLGTVMTDEAFRGQGLIRGLMEEIEKDYAGKVDGMYLFANDSVLDFYPKFGYRKATEYQYVKNVRNTEMQDTEAQAPAVRQLPMRESAQWEKLEAAIDGSVHHERFDMIHNNGLYMFYVTKFMQENVYFDASNDAYVIAEQEGDTLILHSVFAPKQVSLDDVIGAFGDTVQKVVLGFTPENAAGYQAEEVQEEDTTLFVKGGVFEGFEEQRLMFPTLAHA